jgi:aminopeptidase N
LEDVVSTHLRLIVAAVVTFAVTLAGAPPGDAQRGGTFHPGAVDAGDPLVPGYGNGGYDAQHYAIDLTYHPRTGVLEGTTTITARLTEDLSRFNLDFVLPTKTVTVNGQAATFRRVKLPGVFGIELEVTPAAGLPRDTTMTVVVGYSARPATLRRNGSSNWLPTPTGIEVWNEPEAASQWWYPANVYPSDKATYDIAITAPKSLKAITNGLFVDRTVSGSMATSRFRTAPMSTHLSSLAIGDYDIVRRDRGGIQGYYAFERAGGVMMQRARADVLTTPRVIAGLERYFGPYPFASTGAVVTHRGFSTGFESVARPHYTTAWWRHENHRQWVIVHEIAHQWAGDSVGINRWRHIWLAEGFATYAEWLWSESHDRGTARQLFRATYELYPRDDFFWELPVTRPSDSFFLLGTHVYERGAMTLQALRNIVGNRAFFRILRAWTRENADGVVDTADFQHLAERISRKDLAHLFHVWLETDNRPAPRVANGFPEDFARPVVGARTQPPRSFLAIHGSVASRRE